MHRAAELPLLVERNIMAAESCNAGSFHACQASADHADFLLFLRRLDLTEIRSVAEWVDRAAKSYRGIEALDGSDAAHRTADAGNDIVPPARFDLLDPCRIGKLIKQFRAMTNMTPAEYRR